MSHRDGELPTNVSLDRSQRIFEKGELFIKLLSNEI